MTFLFASAPTPSASGGAFLPARPRGVLFPSSAIASGAALLLYVLAALLMPRLAPPARVIDIPRADGPRVIDPLPEVERAWAPPAPPAALARPAEVEPVLDPVLARPVPAPDAEVPGLIPETFMAGPRDARGGVHDRGVEDVPPPTDVGTRDPYFIYHEVAPVRIYTPDPDYPDLARQAGVDGVVIVRAFVGTDGRVSRAEVLRSIPLLDAAAIDAAMRMRFRPAQVSGRPVAVWVAVPIRFHLR